MSGVKKNLTRRMLTVLTVLLVGCGVAVSVVPAAGATHNNQNICGYWVVGLIKHRYDQVSGILGCPTSEELTNPGNTGKRQHFGPRGNIYWKNFDDYAFSIWGKIWDRWAASGYETGTYKYPSSNEGCCASGSGVNDFYFQWFDRNCWAIVWSPTVGYQAWYYCT